MSGDTKLYDQLGEALRSQRERFGPTALENRRRVVSLLADTLPESRREIRAVASALDEGAVEALTGVERSHLGMEMDRQADRLEQAVGLRPDIARQVVRALAYGLDLGPPPSVYEAAPAPITAPPQPIRAVTDDWAGMTQTPSVPQPHQSTPQPPKPKRVLFTVGGVAVGVPQLAIAAALAAGVVIGVPLMAMQGSGGSVAGVADSSGQAVNYADELTDMGVREKAELETNVGSPTPMTVPGGVRLTTVQVRDLLMSDPSALAIDVLLDQHPGTIQGARYLPNAGQPGHFQDAVQAQTVQALQSLTQGRRDQPLIFFCAGSACWESYNAVLRARQAGYTKLYWYRGGLASWHAAGMPMQALPTAASASTSMVGSYG